MPAGGSQAVSQGTAPFWSPVSHPAHSRHLPSSRCKRPGVQSSLLRLYFVSTVSGSRLRGRSRFPRYPRPPHVPSLPVNICRQGVLVTTDELTWTRSLPKSVVDFGDHSAFKILRALPLFVPPSRPWQALLSSLVSLASPWLESYSTSLFRPTSFT